MNDHGNHRHRRFLTVTVAALLGTAATAMAAPMDKLPPEHRQGPVRYVSGGIGKDQSTQMLRDASMFPLALEFVQGGNKQHALYLADVQVQIKDAAGKRVLDTHADGPFLLARLPDGHYTVSAEHAGQTKVRSVQVAQGKHQRIVFDWAP
ncbi:MAG: carboxypeptidase-like regulatory domain-containing protein [Casimicrobiaceae bacterium]